MPVSGQIEEKGYNSDDGSQQQLVFERPSGLKGIYYHPTTQVAMLGFVCFMGPGYVILLSSSFSY